METAMPLVEIEIQDKQENATIDFDNIRVMPSRKVRKKKKFSKTFDAYESFLGWEIVPTPKLSFGTVYIVKVEEETEEETSDEFKALNLETTEELEKYIEDVPVDIEVAKEIIRFYNLKLSAVLYNKFAVELTPSGTMKYKFGLNENSILTVIVPLEIPEELGENGVIYDLTVDGVSVRSNLADIDSLVEAVNAYTNS